MGCGDSNLVGLSCCKLKKIYGCVQILSTLDRPMSPGLVELGAFGLVGLVSRWAHLNLPGPAFTPLMECGFRWVSLGSGESALSGLSGLSFMTIR